ncbi:MAG: hypothetical protein MZW92_16950 [Comamonadaceae bacterium]|nr:hypothetical protein [Comamonadaceae bacterium]
MRPGPGGPQPGHLHPQVLPARIHRAHPATKNARPASAPRLYDAPCENACPANVDAASYISYMGDGTLMEAYFQHMENNPFPIVCGRVCPAFCEKKCARGKYDEAIAIREVKRLFADWAIERGHGLRPAQEAAQGEAWPSSAPARPAWPAPST